MWIVRHESDEYPTEVRDEKGFTVAECAQPAHAEQIVREHNAHAKLLAVCLEAFQFLFRAFEQPGSQAVSAMREKLIAVISEVDPRELASPTPTTPKE